MTYQYLTQSVGGFIQQAAVCYVQRGYWFYVIGHIENGKNPLEVDQIILEKYKVGISKFQRCRRKKEGIAGVQYLRYNNTFLLLATQGEHHFFAEENTAIQDARVSPIRLFGYSIKWQKGRALVSLDEPSFRKLRDSFLQVALRQNPKILGLKFWSIHFDPYSEVYRQINSIWRTVNLKRKTAGLPPVPISAVRRKRRIYRPFESSAPVKSTSIQPENKVNSTSV